MKNNKKDFISGEDKRAANMMLDFFKFLATNNEDDKPEHKGVIPRVNKKIVGNNHDK